MVDVQSSQRSILLIVTEEDGDQAYYLKCEAHFSWPGGASGPTVGVGYDCGYSTADQIEQDWTGFIDSARIAILKTAAGKTGGAGHEFVAAHGRSITISWTESLAQFNAHELPKWETITRNALPNTDKLSGDSFGALVSLTDNRGASYSSPGDRYLEMRNIKAHMAALRFDLIPGEFLSMRRLWPPASSDLYKRRTHEALLFRDGLAAPELTAATTMPAIAPIDHSTEALQSDLNKLGASPVLDVDGDYGPATKTAVRVFQKKSGLALIDGIAGEQQTWPAITKALAALPIVEEKAK